MPFEGHSSSVLFFPLNGKLNPRIQTWPPLVGARRYEGRASSWGTLETGSTVVAVARTTRSDGHDDLL